MPSYKNNLTSRQVQEGIVFDPGVTKAVNTILVEASLSVTSDTGLVVGDVITGGTTGVTARILRKVGGRLDLVELTLAGEYTNFAVGETVTGSVSTDHAHVVTASLRLTKTLATPYFNPGVANTTHTITAVGSGDKYAYIDVDTCKSIKITNTTSGGDTATITAYAESKSNTPALGVIAKDGDPVTFDVPHAGVSLIILTFNAAGAATVEEFTKTVAELEAEAVAAIGDATLNSAESYAVRAESIARKAKSQAALDPVGASYAALAISVARLGQSTARKAESQGTLDNSRADLGIAGASIARLGQSTARTAESQGTLDNSIADRGQSLGRRAQSVALTAESQGTLDNSRADLGVAGKSIAVLAASRATLALSLARAS